MLEIKDLTVSTNGKRILNDINLSIGRGETVALFGPNGSGKTSLLSYKTTAAIVRGFLEVKIKGLPENLETEIKKAVRVEEKKERLL